MKRVPMPPRKNPMPRGSLRSKASGSGDLKPAKSKTPRYTGPTKKMRFAVLQRDDYTCQRCGRDISNLPYSLQHRLPRGRGGTNTMCNLVTVCGSATSPDMCHDDIENQARLRAAREGWLVPNGYTPEVWPVKRFGESWEMPGEERWVEWEPHPDQLGYRQAA